MKYLVTGQHGFLGKRFVEKLRENNIEPILVEGDLLDRKTLDIDIDDDFLIVHFAGFVKDPDDAKKNYDNNTIATFPVIHLAQRKQCKGLIYISSIAVVGGMDSSRDELMDFQTDCNPTSPYGWSKYISEMAFPYFGLERYWVVRPTNIVDGIEHGVFRKMEDAFQKGEAYRLFDKTKNILRDFISVRDVIDSVYNLVMNLDQLPVKQQIIILGSGHSYTYEEAVELFKEKIWPGLRVEVTSPDVPITPRNVVVDASQTKALLGREPETLEEMLDRTAKGCRQKM